MREGQCAPVGAVDSTGLPSQGLCCWDGRNIVPLGLSLHKTRVWALVPGLSSLHSAPSPPHHFTPTPRSR